MGVLGIAVFPHILKLLQPIFVVFVVVSKAYKWEEVRAGLTLTLLGLSSQI